MNTTLVFESFEHFSKRENKSINGVSKEFAEKHSDSLQQNATNYGCWNCSGCHFCASCTDCFLCTCCTSCFDCRGCRNCQNCEFSKTLSFCSNCSRCTDCIYCQSCNHSQNLYFCDNLTLGFTNYKFNEYLQPPETQ